MPVQKLKEFLDSHHVKYATSLHSPAFTAQEVAAAAHVPGRQLAKVVIVKINEKLAMVVLPANEQVNFSSLQRIVGQPVDLASESEFKDKFAGCEVGTMPPFGNLYDMPVYVSNKLDRNKPILFCAGSHSELIQMAFNDFENLVHPEIVTM